MWTCAKFFKKKEYIFSIIKFREKYFIKKFDINLKGISKILEINEDIIINEYNDKFKVIPKSVTKTFNSKILKLDNLCIVDLDHNELETLKLKGLLDKDLIRPLYLG